MFQGISVVPKGCQATFSVWCGTQDIYGAIKGKWASPPVDLGYTKLFCIPAVTAVFLSSYDSGLGDSLVFCQAHWGSLCVWLGTRNCSAPNAGVLGFISCRGGFLIWFLELQQEPGVYSWVTVGVSFRNSTLFSEVRSPVLLWQTPQESKLGLAQ